MVLYTRLYKDNSHLPNAGHQSSAQNHQIQTLLCAHTYRVDSFHSSILDDEENLLGEALAKGYNREYYR